MKSTFGAVVPVLNEIEHVSQCLTCLRRALCAAGGGPLVFVDNGSKDGTYELLQRSIAKNEVLLRAPRLSVGSLRNLGAARCDVEYLGFVDADCLVAEDYFTAAQQVLQSTGAAATGSYYALPDNPTPVELTWYNLHAPRKDGDAHLIPSGNLIVSKAAFTAVHGFSERLITGEDAEFCDRLLRGGYRLYESRTVRVTHLGNPTAYLPFVRQQYWHAQGMFGSMRPGLLDRPTAMTLLHAISIIVGLILVVARPTLPRLLIALVIVMLPSVTTVLYRLWQSRRRVNLLRAALLYFLYYGARLTAAPGALLKRIRGNYNQPVSNPSSR